MRKMVLAEMLSTCIASEGQEIQLIARFDGAMSCSSDLYFNHGLAVLLAFHPRAATKAIHNGAARPWLIKVA